MIVPMMLHGVVSFVVYGLMWLWENLRGQDAYHDEHASLFGLVCGVTNEQGDEACYDVWWYGHELCAIVGEAETLDDGWEE